MSVDKANVLDTSRLWRRVVDEVAADYPDVRLRHALVDSFAMEIVTSPERIDVVVTENTFGDILSDVAAAVTGGLGLAASASLGDGGPGIFEPVHGSAPDIAGTGTANPSAMLRSVALLLEHGLGRLDLAAALDAAVDAVLVSQRRRATLGGDATTIRVRRRRASTALERLPRDDGARDERHRRLSRARPAATATRPRRCSCPDAVRPSGCRASRRSSTPRPRRR